MKYAAKFTGRQNGAIGIFHPVETTVEGENKEAARLALYDRFEHITGLEIHVIEEAGKHFAGAGPFRYEVPQPRCFRIIRFYRSGRKARTVKQSLTEAEAQAHCSREDTHGEGWFDGYDYMKGCRP